MKTAYIVKINDEGVFCSTEPKPEYPDHYYGMVRYATALKQWEDNLIRVENTVPLKSLMHGDIWGIDIDRNMWKTKLSQQVEIQLTQEGCKIMKI